MAKKVIGLGNALMDILIKADDALIEQLGLKKGIFNLIDKAQAKSILYTIKEMEKHIIPGGGVSNTIAGIAHLGGSSAFWGKVGKDEYGQKYQQLTSQAKVDSKIVQCDSQTGIAITFITPDSQRTFAVSLGCAPTLTKDEISEEHMQDCDYFHVSGYKIDPDIMRDTAYWAMKKAKEKGMKISFDVADPMLIERRKDIIHDIIDNYADIVFANEEEAKILYGCEPEEALNKLAEKCEIAVVKLGKKGALVKQNDQMHKIRSFKVDAIDTTGAGDMFAAGFLYGLSTEQPLDKSGLIGSYAASKVVSKIGARLEEPIEIESIFSS